MKLYTIRAAIFSQVRTGDVWTTETFDSRLIKIKNQNNKSIVVSNRKIDNNLKKIYKESGHTKEIYNKDVVVIDEYYRNKLKIEANKNIELNITRVCKYQIGCNIRYLIEHPNDSIRITTWLAIISIIFGIISIIIGIIGLVPPLHEFTNKHMLIFCC